MAVSSTSVSPNDPEIAQAIITPQRGRAVAAGRRFLTFGTGLGVIVNGGNLEVSIVRSRPSGSVEAASTVIKDFENRPAAEWGSELLRFLDSAGEKQLAATVLLPRDEVIVRALHLPGVPEKDTAAAVELQIDTLHPYDDEEVAWTWWRIGPQDVAVGVVRGAVLRHYETLFSEAGVPMAAATVSAAVIYAALRVRGAAPASFLCYIADDRDRTEIYGESQARPLYSAGLSPNRERSLAVARAELRIDPQFAAVSLGEALSCPSAGAMAYATALAVSAPLTVRLPNLLPAERRASHSRTQYLLPATLALLIVLGLVIVFVIYPLLEERRYASDLAAEAKRLEPAVLRVQQITKRTASDRERIAALDEFRRRPQADLDLLNELTKILPPQVWTSSIEIYPDSVVLAGEADQAAPLLKLLDSSPLLQNSEFVLGVSRNAQNEIFRIKSMRRNRTGRTTP